MKEGPVISAIASLIGDPARANMLSCLMDGRSLTASELAGHAGITAQTASSHLARLVDAGLIEVSRQGRHRYFRISGEDVAQVLEMLMTIAERTGAKRVRTGPRDPALRRARICYDHLAGEQGVLLLKSLKEQALLSGDEDPALTEAGRRFFGDFGIAVDALESARRPLCRHCLDWSERHYHLGGSLGAALLTMMIDRGWVRRGEGRVLEFTRSGTTAFARTFCLPA